MKNTESKLFKNPLAIAVVAATGFAATSAYAQALALEEVVVTAQKRAESLQDVPISVSAMGGDKLAEAGIENLQDLSAYVPNLKVVDGGLVPLMFIRGIGSGANQGFEQSVGTYSDGIYMGRSLQSRSSFMDLERVEVLRGPQSILFGKNSIAGAISLVSAKPTDDFEGKASISYAPEYGETEVNAYVSGPITESLRARLAVRDRQEDGYLENITRNSEAPQADEKAARLTVDWDVSDNLLATLKLETADIERAGRIGQVIDYGNYQVNPATAGLLNGDDEFDYKVGANEDNKLSFESNNVVLKLDYIVGEHTITSTTGYSDFDYQETNYDGDWSEIRVVDMDMAEEFEQFSQEIRLTSPGGEAVDYIMGAFYQTSEQEYSELARLSPSTVGLVAGGLPVFDSAVDRPFTQEGDTWAVFAQATWNATDRLRLTAGLRYTEEKKEGTRDQTLYSLNLAPGVKQSDIELIPNSGFTVENALALDASAGGFRLADHSLSGKRDEEVLTPSLNVQYDLTGDIMLYATYSTGYKSGGFDARGINGATSANNPNGYNILAMGGDNFQFDEEEAETLELGAKMTLLDGAAELNLAAYQTDYTDMQVSVYDGTFGYSVFNAGAAKVQGLELDGRWMATENLMFVASAAYLNYEWTDYSEGVCPGVGTQIASPSGSGNCDLSGRENMHAPEWTVNLSANHDYTLTDNLQLRTTLDANFMDNHYVAGSLDRRQEQAAATTFNARIALSPFDEKWQVALSGKNLTDQRIMTNGSDVTLSNLGPLPGGVQAEIKRPRTLAIEASYSF
ncbi:TonB-dependent receptor [Aestuariicella hydrocarbonica]|uniref:TonB-dependent receptor n=1 Tax=Pseudomaricurvus hydrocarbonicus TaxID=1470433 RepID=A0A9E5MNH8_9GAMM|nr:TonB-dependent receptor [Aestuariicella hydrocarbonica]NHO67480.1 TonB-dependent receptor [Aestuariicella hydrocarbonica]